MKFANLTLAQRFAALLAVVVVGFAAYGACSFKVLADLKVNGPTYERIVQGKDLIADILPPPEYIIESYLVSLQAISATPDQRKPLIENLKSLKNDYDTRHAYWTSANLDATLRGQLLEKADKPNCFRQHGSFEPYRSTSGGVGRDCFLNGRVDSDSQAKCQ